MAFDERRSKYDSMKDEIMSGCNGVFTKLLGRRGHNGHISVSEEARAKTCTETSRARSQVYVPFIR